MSDDRKFAATGGEELTTPASAALAGMSVDSFERRFRALLRETPLKYLNRIRPLEYRRKYAGKDLG